MSSSVGIIKFPTEWKVIQNSMVPNPQPEFFHEKNHEIQNFPGHLKDVHPQISRVFFRSISNLHFEAAAVQGHKWLPTPIGMRPGAKALWHDLPGKLTVCELENQHVNINQL